MKFKTLTTIAILISIGVLAQDPASKPKEIKLNSSADTLQYSIGAFIGQWMLKTNFRLPMPMCF